MSRLKRMIGIKATKVAAKHTAHGVAAKAQRKPLRSAAWSASGWPSGSAPGSPRAGRSSARRPGAISSGHVPWMNIYREDSKE